MINSKRISLRTKLTLFMWSVMLLLIIFPVYLIFSSLEGEVRKEAVHRAEEVCGALVLALDAEFGREGEVDLQGFVNRAGKDLNLRVTFVNKNGYVRADSDVERSRLEELDNHINRPEIKSALRNGNGNSIRYSRTVKDVLLYYARKIGGDTLPEGYLRISMPYSRVQKALDRMSGDIWAIVLACFLGSGLVIFFIVRQLTRSIKELSSTAEAIGQGDYSRRVYEVPAPEFRPLADSLNEMAHDVEHNLKLISKQKIELEVILDSMKDGVLALDRHGHIQNCNRYFQKMFTSTSACTGKRPLEIIMHSELQKLCDKALSRDKNENFDLLIQVDDRFFDVNVVNTPGAGDLGAIVVFHDITELKRVENMRKDFVSNASHELRTPLTSIKGYAETLLGNEKILQEKGPEMLEVIHKNANSMMRLLEDILQLSRIESEREVLEMETVDMQHVISKAWSECSSLIQDKDINFEGEIDPACITVQADSGGLVQVLRNLLENSIKYVPKRGGLIRVLCRDKESEVWVGVEDNGPGIPLNAQERVFERFYRVEEHRSGQVKGTGLGLSICRNILRRIDGRIWVESPVPDSDTGTIVWMALLKANVQE